VLFPSLCRAIFFFFPFPPFSSPNNQWLLLRDSFPLFQSFRGTAPPFSLFFPIAVVSNFFFLSHPRVQVLGSFQLFFFSFLIGMADIVLPSFLPFFPWDAPLFLFFPLPPPRKTTQFDSLCPSFFLFFFSPLYRDMRSHLYPPFPFGPALFFPPPCSTK